MRWISLVAASVCSCGAAEWTLYVCMATTRDYVVGAKLSSSGVFSRTGPGKWQQTGHPNPFTFSLDYDRTEPSRLYLAAGNGIIRLTAGSRPWKVLTGSGVTEMRDVVTGPDGSIYYAYVRGVRVSSDGGRTWRDIGAGLQHRYTETIRIDNENPRVLLAGTDSGLFRSTNGGDSWQPAGASGFSIMRIEQSPHDACFWLAATERGGLFASRDCGVSFENTAKQFGVDRVLYDISFDRTTPGRVAAAGWGPGVAVSNDNGTTWEARNTGLPNTNIWTAAFDPAHPGRLFAGVHEEAVYVSDDAGTSWTRDGLEGTIVTRMLFVPLKDKRP